MESQKLTRELLERYFAGQCTEAEKKIVQDYIRTHDNDDALLSQFMEQLWEETDHDTVTTPDPVSASTRYEKIRTQIRQGSSTAYKLYYRIAASVVIVAVFSTLYYRYANAIYNYINPVVYRNYHTRAGERMRLTLPDSSVVWLNSMSTIRFPGEFRENTREIQLEGEAFFQVSKNKEKPFIVHVDDLYTRVLGTSFNIEAYRDEETMRVTVTEGKVAVGVTLDSLTAKTEQFSLLIANEQLSCNRTSKAFKKEQVGSAVAFTSWTEGNISFRTASLAQVITTLERRYAVAIETDASVNRDCTFTADFPSGTSLHDVLKILSMTRKISYEIKGHIIKISPRC